MQADTAPSPILVDATQAAQLLNISLRGFHNLRKTVGFPAPIVLGQRTTRWVYADLMAYFATAPRKLAEEPKQLAAARAAKAAGLAPAPAPFNGVAA